MNVVFMGTPDIARDCLQEIISSGYRVVGVYTKSDTPKNRGMKLSISPVKQAAMDLNLPVFQPTTFRDEAVAEELRALRPDLIVVVAYGKILPQSILDIPRLGCVNMHTSILPELRGAGPVQWAILNHCTQTGVTAMYMSAGMDEGDIIEIRKTDIDPTETAEELLGRLSKIAAELCRDTLRNVEKGTASRTPQEHEKATYAPMLTRALSPMNFSNTARALVDQVRGLIPWPVATCQIAGTTFKIFAAEDAGEPSCAPPGTLLALTGRGLKIACGDGAVYLTQLQAEGRKRMSAADYFRGHPITI